MPFSKKIDEGVDHSGTSLFNSGAFLNLQNMFDKRGPHWYSFSRTKLFKISALAVIFYPNICQTSTTMINSFTLFDFA